MKKYIVLLLSSVLALLSFPANAEYAPKYYFRWHCDSDTDICHKVYYQRWPSHEKNMWRKNFRKKTVPEPKHVFVAPPEKIAESNIIKVNLTHGTWGAYDSQGDLVNSGRISGGKSYCPDIRKACKTATGTFTVYDKRGPKCKSKIFPVGKGGAPMPYCMFFHQGYAMHGSNSVPNYNASHGCVRMAPADAKWLSENFVNVGSTRVNVTYDKVDSPIQAKTDDKVILPVKAKTK